MSMDTLVTLLVGVFGFVGSIWSYQNGKNSNNIDIYDKLREYENDLHNTNIELYNQQKQNLELKNKIDDLNDTIDDLKKTIDKLNKELNN